MNDREYAESMLNNLANLRYEREKLVAPLEKKIIALQLQEMELAGELDARIKMAETSAKSAAIVVGETVRGHSLQSVWNKGKSKWDNTGLKEFAKRNPSIMEYYSEGKPYIAIRAYDSLKRENGE